MSECTEEKKKRGQEAGTIFVTQQMCYTGWESYVLCLKKHCQVQKIEVRMLFGAGAFLLQCGLHVDSFSPQCSPVSVLET